MDERTWCGFASRPRCSFASWLSAVMAYAGPFDFPPADFNIMDADGTQVIGHGHYEVTPDGKGHETAFGEDRFNDGEYDIERDRLELRSDDQVPRMVTFEHTFFNPNGTLQRVNRANFQNRYHLVHPIRERPTGGAQHGPAISSGHVRRIGNRYTARIRERNSLLQIGIP